MQENNLTPDSLETNNLLKKAQSKQKVKGPLDTEPEHDRSVR